MSRPWAPSSLHERDRVSAGAALALYDLLEAAGEPPQEGDPLPVLWHWLAFPPRARQSELGQDGHPTTGTFLPPTGGRQRMFAGAAVVTAGRVAVEERLERTSSVTEVRETRGRSGPLMFVTVDRELRGTAGTVQERDTVVYKEGVSAPPVPVTEPLVGEDDAAWTWSRSVPADPVLLFRFSALTYNAHRIHYDRDYAVGVEGYPGLVVHGPLQALLLADLAGRVLPGRTVSEFSFRSYAPVFDGAPLELRARPTAPGEVELAVLTSLGRRAMSATATVVPREGESS